MKRIMKISLILVVVMAFNLTYGNAPKFPSKDEKIVYVTFENVKPGSILSLINENGLVMYTQVMSSQGTFSKQFDFTLLPSGRYTFEMEAAYEVKVKTLTVTNQNVSFLSEGEAVFFKPVVKMKDNLVFVSQLSLNEEPLKVNLFYTEKGENEVKLYSETFQGNNQYIIEKVLTLSKRFPGNYKVVLSANDHVYIENFEL